MIEKIPVSLRVQEGIDLTYPSIGNFLQREFKDLCTEPKYVVKWGVSWIARGKQNTGKPVKERIVQPESAHILTSVLRYCFEFTQSRKKEPYISGFESRNELTKVENSAAIFTLGFRYSQSTQPRVLDHNALWSKVLTWRLMEDFLLTPRKWGRN